MLVPGWRGGLFLGKRIRKIAGTPFVLQCARIRGSNDQSAINVERSPGGAIGVYTGSSFYPLTALGSCGGCAVYWVGSPPQPALLLQPYILPSSVSASPLCGHLSGTLGWLSQGGPIYGSKAVAPERHLPGKV